MGSGERADVVCVASWNADLVSRVPRPIGRGETLMATLQNDRGWLRVRPPLEALNDAEYARLSAQIRAYGIDEKTD